MAQSKKTDLVRKGNDLIEASYKLSVTEQKLIILLASKIKKTDEPFQTYTLGIKEFSDLTGVSSKNRYKELRNITLNLMKKAFEVRIRNKVIQVAWLAFVSYNEGEGTIDVQFAPFLKEYLFQLQKNYTTYEVKNIVQLKKAASIRMYELLKRFAPLMREKTFTLQELREKLGCDDQDAYQEYSNFKMRILKPSQKELESKTDIKFQFTEIKKGRKVESIHFTFQVDKQNNTNQIEDHASNKEDVRLIKNALDLHGLSVKKETMESWSQYGASKIVDLLRHATNTRSIHNPIGFVTWSVQQGLTASVFKTTKGRKEIVPLWLQKQKEEENKIPLWRDEEPSPFPNSDGQELDLEEERRRLEEELKMYRR